MDPNQEGQPTQGGSVPPASGMPPEQTGDSAAPAAPAVPEASGMPPTQPAGIPPAQTDGSPTPAMPPEQSASTPSAGNPVFGTQGTMPTADTSSVTSPAPISAPGVVSASGAPATPPLTPRRSFRSAQANSANATNQFAQPAQDQPGIIASGGQPVSAGKKPSKGLIIGIIVIAILAIVAVVVGIVASSGSKTGKSSNGSTSSSASINMTELSNAYNNLANYIAFGDENTDEKKIEGKSYTTRELLKVSVDGYQLNPVLEADKMIDGENSAKKTTYFSKFDELYQNLPSNLSSYNIYPEDLYNYFHSFSLINFIPESSIISRYYAEGLESTRNYIEKTVNSNLNDPLAAQYANSLRDYNLALLNILEDAKVNLNCKVEIDNTNNCNLASLSSYNAYDSARTNIYAGDAYDIRAGYRRAAVQVLFNIYDLLEGSTESTR